MSIAPRLVLTLALACAVVAPARAQLLEARASRTWIAGQEAGGAVRKVSREPAGIRIEDHEWTRIERMGIEIAQDLVQTALKRPDGSLQFTFTLSLAQEPVQGQASWSPTEPGRLQFAYKGLPARTLDLPKGVVLWPGDEDALMKAAARARAPIHIKGFSVATQQAADMDLEPVGPEPLPGYPDTVRYRGKASEGPMVQEVDVWISPEHADVRQAGSFAGIPLLTQRDGLPPPAPAEPGAGFFERTLRTLPGHPFLPWVAQATVRWTGASVQNLPEDDQQRRLGPNRYQLTQAAPLTAAARAQPPVTGPSAAEDAPFLAETPLVQYRDPVFAGLVKRLNPPPGASRYELARLVTAFVYDWIQDKDYTVGFASAQEVARNPRGDCTEHGVLAVALLRRLGVPARGAVGWVAMGGAMGLHFWVEARIGGRWYPLDPTFAMVPASALRIKLGTTDLADLGAVGWENAAASFQEGAWQPEPPWPGDLRLQGDTVYAPGRTLRLPGARWELRNGALLLDGARQVNASPRPAPAQKVRLLQGRTGRKGWFGDGGLWLDCGEGCWLQVACPDEQGAFALLDGLEIRPAA